MILWMFRDLGNDGSMMPRRKLRWLYNLFIVVGIMDFCDRLLHSFEALIKVRCRCVRRVVFARKSTVSKRFPLFAGWAFEPETKLAVFVVHDLGGND